MLCTCYALGRLIVFPVGSLIILVKSTLLYLATVQMVQKVDIFLKKNIFYFYSLGNSCLQGLWGFAGLHSQDTPVLE